MLEKYKLYLFINGNALGDIVACLPVVKKIIDISGDVFVCVPPQFMDLFWFVDKDKLLNGSGKVTILKGYGIRQLNYIDKSIKMICPLCEGKLQAEMKEEHALWIGASKLNLTHYASLNLIKEIWDLPYLKYPQAKSSKYKQIKDRIIIQASFRTPTRRFYDYQIQEMIDKLNQAGEKPVLVGKIDVANDFQGRYTDLRNKTDLIEMLYLFQNNKKFICLDGGLYHLSMMTDIKPICCFTNIRPDRRLPNGHNVTVIEPDSECRYCGTDHHYMNIPAECCIHDIDYACVKSLDIAKIIEEAAK